ncbi:hypothetical protein M8C13_04420 [Crossiella sp. SN42]|uniref:hypothetical protein n=1 Tax=Crossiella sp. SN42 TaxID=2944808 RepID=UPI00207CFAEE|nr:hypothetical protein [Crossiella sp. SN42]MCO1575003.1 hypothetical protein [Crossiella sp. SN42]
MNPTQHRAQCGTRAGYLRHHSNKELACDPCLAAANKFHTAYLIRQGTQRSCRISVSTLRLLLDDPTAGRDALAAELGDLVVSAISGTAPSTP